MSDRDFVARERADWLLDAVATATQDRRYLRGDPLYDEVAGAAILMNGEKAIRTALEQIATQTATSDENVSLAIDPKTGKILP